MLAAEELTETQWQIADAIARQLVLDGTDVNELRKTITYLRARQDELGAGKKFFDYLKTLVRHSNRIGHSKRTLDYFQSLNAVCNQFLKNYQDDAPRMLHILSWAARLVHYYNNGVPTGEIERPTVKQENTFTVGQELEATVAVVRGNKVTYELLGKIRLTQKEHQQLDKMSEGKKIRIEILQLRDDGLPKKVKPIL